jgi:FKBP-type peptidyl-prolyl cis-trans isomerase SlyD
MSIQKDSVVTFHYTLKDDAGEVIDSSDGGDPLAYLHGHGNLVAGLERELTGKVAGDKLNVKVTPADGYGEYDQSMVQRVPRRQLKGIAKIQVGMKLHAQTQEGPREVTVTQVLGDTVTIDANHLRHPRHRRARGDGRRAGARSRPRRPRAPSLAVQVLRPALPLTPAAELVLPRRIQRCAGIKGRGGRERQRP